MYDFFSNLITYLNFKTTLYLRQFHVVYCLLLESYDVVNHKVTSTYQFQVNKLSSLDSGVLKYILPF